MRKTLKYWVKCPFMYLKVTSEDQIVHREPISNNPSYYFPFRAVYNNWQLTMRMATGQQWDAGLLAPPTAWQHRATLLGR